MKSSCRLIAVSAIISAVACSVNAETTTDRYGKELKIEPARNMFARFGLLGFKMNNKSEAAKDVSGPVLAAGDRGWYCPSVDGVPDCSEPRATIYGTTTQDTLFGTPGNGTTLPSANYTGVSVLGLPDDVRARIADPAPGAVGTLGMYFDENKKWAIEVPVMALPFAISVYGDGTFKQAGEIITGKALGFFVFGHYYFGEKNSKFRPSVSLTANYLAPFDMQATPELVRWTGGRTKISTKGSFGLGWLVGGKYAINDRWDINVNVGQFKARVDTTLTTYDTSFNGTQNVARRSPVFQYWPGKLGENLRYLRGVSSTDNLLKPILDGMMAYRNSDPANRVNGGANLGNFTRTQRQTLDPYLLIMTVGYNF